MLPVVKEQSEISDHPVTPVACQLAYDHGQWV